MALKRKVVLTRDELREAIDAHQVSISQIAKATDIPRSYLSEFLSIGRPLKPEQLTAIREYLVSEGVEFEDDPTLVPRPAPPSLPAGVTIASLWYFPVQPARLAEAAAVASEMERNDVRIAELLGSAAERDTGLFGDGDFTHESQEALRELYALLGANYLLFRYLTLEKNPLESVTGDSTLRSAVVEMLRESFDKAGVPTAPLDPPPTPEPDREAEAA